MPLAPGHTLAQYRITAALGAGGMGEVCRATDTKLGRDVALKLLPEAFAADPDRLARFEREAKLLASSTTPASPTSMAWGVGDMDTVVTFTLTPTASGTRLSLVQSGFKPHQKQNFAGAAAAGR